MSFRLIPKSVRILSIANVLHLMSVQSSDLLKQPDFHNVYNDQAGRFNGHALTRIRDLADDDDDDDDDVVCRVAAETSSSSSRQLEDGVDGRRRRGGAGCRSVRSASTAARQVQLIEASVARQV